MTKGDGKEIHIEFDEKTLLMQRTLRYKELYSTLESGMFIRNQIETFSKAKIFDKQMEIMLPDSFKVMPDEYAKVKYPSHFRPHVIFTNADLSINLGFSLFSEKAGENELEDMAVHLKSILKRTNPNIQFYGQEAKKTSNILKVQYDFRTQALDEAIYNIHFLAVINHRVMHGMFNCLYRETDDWYEMAQQIIESIRDISTDWRERFESR